MSKTTAHLGLRVDLNGDGQLTLSDLPAWMVEAFFVPGDWLIWATLTYAPPVARLLGVDAADYGGTLAGVLSAVAWLLGARLVVSTYVAARDFDHALTSRLIGKYEEARRRVRVGLALLGYWLRRRLKRQRSDHEAVLLPEKLELTDQEWRVLRLHDKLQPGYALAFSDIVASLKLSRNETRKVLEGLLRPSLLTATLGAGDGENAYTITRAGRAFLLFHQVRSGEEKTQSLPACPAID